MISKMFHCLCLIKRNWNAITYNACVVSLKNEDSNENKNDQS